jgi:predicted metal-dependent phosphoesterase TrpH
VKGWRQVLAWVLVAAGLVIGTLADAVPVRNPPQHDGDWILAADFHLHGFPGDGALTPWVLRSEAAREGLDVIAVTNHNRMGAARLGAWLPRENGEPLILVGQEVTGPNFHLIAVGIEQEVDWRQPPSAIIEAIHAQGGAAIAAHPFKAYSGYDDAALAALDGAEAATCARANPTRRAELEAFFDHAVQRNPDVAPIGSSDFHFSGPLGSCRTYVFAREWSTRGVVQAIREGRTVAYNEWGAGRGDPARAAIVERIRREAEGPARSGEVWRHVSVALTLVGMFLVVILSSARRTRR